MNRGDYLKLESINKVHEGKFITRYDITYRTGNDNVKVYEMISRNKNISGKDEIKNNNIDAVVIIMHSKDGEEVLLNREFRMAADEWVYNFPAGLIEPGETIEQAAGRELKEETGLDIVEITDVIGESYSAIGFSNEKNECVVGVAEGIICDSDSEYEEIKAAWYTKDEVRKLLKENIFAARSQAYCYLWSMNSSMH